MLNVEINRALLSARLDHVK